MTRPRLIAWTVITAAVLALAASLILSPVPRCHGWLRIGPGPGGARTEWLPECRDAP
jgi:hypothetical protein